jgi:hypothetical protein
MTPSSEPTKVLAEQLLNAQVAFIKARLNSPEVGHYANSLIRFLLQQGNELALEEAVSRDSIKQVIQVYAFDLNLGGGMLELVGEMARRLYTESNLWAPTLQTLMTDAQMEQWIDKVLELEQVRLHLVQAVLQSPAAHELVAQVTANLLKKQRPNWHDHAIDSLSNSWLAKKSPLSGVINTLVQQEEKVLSLIEQQISQFVQNQSSQLLSLEAAELKDIAWQLWQNIKDVPLNQLSSGIESLDIEEFFVLVYELWRHLRQTDYIQRLILTGVDVFFDVYGDYPLSELLEEIGITPDHLFNDAQRFLPQAIAALNAHDVLDQLIRLQLHDFYHDAGTLSLIEQSLS